MTDDTQREPRYAYEDPAALAWTAQMFRTARRRRLARKAAERAEEEAAKPSLAEIVARARARSDTDPTWRGDYRAPG
jgi:hypothetical protein